MDLSKILLFGKELMSSGDAFNLVESGILLFGKQLTLSQTSPGFYVSAVQVF